jgi:hypothetical protein
VYLCVLITLTDSQRLLCAGKPSFVLERVGEKTHVSWSNLAPSGSEKFAKFLYCAPFPSLQTLIAVRPPKRPEIRSDAWCMPPALPARNFLFPNQHPNLDFSSETLDIQAILEYMSKF